ncbi:MAG: glycosyltransferase [Phycisphaerae bacterium]|jgi:cellulose synthase/poly-beta-1,6-N-acetylglucosamine synthase-like glycosyltransferase
MSISSPDYSIVMPAYNEAAYLGRTLKAAKDAQNHFPDRTGEIIVVDNNSTDQTADIAKSFGATVIFEPVNQISKARNRGAKAAKGKYLIFLDADSILSGQLLGKTLELLDSGKIAGGGTLLDDSGTKIFKIKLLIWFWNFISRFRNLAAGLYLFCLRQTWQDIGGFDETVYIAEELIFSKHLKTWAKKHNMKFCILDIRIQTSWRKYKWFSYKTIVFSLVLGWFFKKNKDKCRLWYERSIVQKPNQ